MSDLTLIIGNKNYSSWSLRPWILMKYYRVDFLEKRVALFTDTTAGELSEYNSDLKVPILKDKELVVWDSLSILEYVSEQYLSGQGWPRDKKARAVARSVCSEMHSSYFNVRNELPMNCRKQFNSISLSKSAEKEIERIRALWRKCRSEYGSEGEWLFGNYSIADAMFAPIALRFSGYNIPLSGIEEAYVKSVSEDPAIVEWIEAGKLETEVIETDEIET
jgi:glutathione S-transferase